MSAWQVLRTAAGRGAPPRRALWVAVAWGCAAQLAGVTLVGSAAGLLAWSSTRPGLAAVAGLLVAVELVAFSRAPLRHLARRRSHDLGLGGLAGWRTWLLDAVATWSPSQLAEARAGDLLARCLDDTDAVQDLWVRVVLPALSTVATLVVAALALLVLAPLAGLAVLVATLLVVWAGWRTATFLCASGAESARFRGVAAARVVELVQAAAALTLLGADGEHRARTEDVLQRRDALMARADAALARLLLLAAGCGAAAVVVAALALGVPTHRPGLPVGVLLSVVACAEVLFALPTSLESLGAVAGAAVRLDEVAATAGSGTATAAPGALELLGADLAASTSGPVLLTDVHLRLDPGTTVAVVGPTGSGKSVLLASSARLERLRGGRVTLGGVDLDELDEPSLRSRVAWLPEQPALLGGRVRDVVDLGRGSDDERLRSVLEDVGLWGALADRGGLDAVLSHRAEDLSGGERRRLALARVLVGRPDLCVLDEPTAGLDRDGARALLDAARASGAGLLVASHDPTVAEGATRRHAVREGRVEAVDP